MKQVVVGLLAIAMLAVGASSASADLIVGGPGDDVLEGTAGLRTSCGGAAATTR